MILALILLGVTAGLKSFGDIEYADGFGPLTVDWPSSWVVSRIQADSNYVGTADLIYIYFNVDNLDSTSTYTATISMPSETEETVCKVALYNSNAGDWVATCDYTFTTTTYVYGPIKFVLSESANGRIIAQDQALGFLALWEGSQPTADSTMTVSYGDESETATHIVSAEESLKFSFTLPTTSGIYNGDYFEIIPDGFSIGAPTVTMDSTLESSSSFSNPAAVTIIDDNETPSDSSDDTVEKIYVYGCVDDVAAGSVITFTLTKFFNPSVVTSGGGNSWTLKVYRYGTKTLIAHYTATGPSTGVTAGAVTVSSWTPYTSSAFDTSTNIIATLEAYWTLSFKMDHDVPEDGTITVTYTGVTINDYDLVTSAKQAKAAFDTNEMVFATTTGSSSLSPEITSSTVCVITVTGSDLAAGSTVTLINYLKISSGSSITATVVTKMDTDVIDQQKTASSVALTSTGNTVYSSTAAVWIAQAKDDTTEITAVNQVEEYGLVIKFTPVVDLAADQLIDIYLPYAIGSTANSKNIVFSSSLWGVSNNENAFATDTVSTGTDAGSVTPGTGKITFKLAGSLTNSAGGILYIGSTSKTNPGNVYTPLLSLLEPSEVIIKYTVSSKTYYESTLLSFESASFSNNPTINFLCIDLSLNGNPVKVAYTPNAYTISSGATVKTMFAFNDGSNLDLSLGDLTEGDIYPSSRGDLKLDSDGNVYFTSLTSISATATEFYIPLPAVAQGDTVTVTISIWITPKGSVSSFRIYKDTAATSATAAPGSSVGGPAAAAFTSKVATSASASITLKTATAADLNGDSDTTDSVPYSVVLILPGGFTTTDSKLTPNALVSSSAGFSFNVYFKEGFGTINEGAASSYSLSITPPSWKIVSVTDGYTFAIAYSSTLNDAECTALQNDIESTAGDITVSNYAPSTVINYSYNSRTTSGVTITFKGGSTIVKGSVISITTGWSGSTLSDWSVKAGSVTLVGDTFASDVWTSVPIEADISSTTSIVVTISKVSRPAFGTTSTFQGFTSISIENEDEDEYLAWTNNAQTTTTPSDPTVKKQDTSKASMWVFPNAAGATGVYFGLSFTSTYLIPSGATIAIQGSFEDNSNVREDLWCSHSFTSASITSGTLTINLSEDLTAGGVFEFVLDYAIDIDASATTSTLSQVLVTVTCDDSASTVVIADTTSNAASQKYSITTSPTNTITEFSFDSESKDAGFVTWYEFNFTLSAASPEEFWVNLDFDSGYDAIPGPGYTFVDTGDLILIPAMDSDGDDLFCTASHWVVSCYFDYVVEESTQLSFSLEIYNGQSSGLIHAYIVDKDEKLLYKPYYSSSSTDKLTFTSSLQNSIDLYFADTEYTDSTKTENNLELWAFVDIAAKADSSFGVKFPMPYELTLTEESTIDCSISYYNSDEEDDVIETVLDSTCEVDGNMVYFTLAADQTFTDNNWTLFTIYDLDTPSTGFKRTQWSYEAAGLDYSSGSFCLLYFNSEEVASGASFDNLNAAFTEFDEIDDYIRLEVNNQLSVQVTPGTAGGPYKITSSDDEVDALSLKVTVQKDSDTEDIWLSDEGVYTLDYLNTEAEFYIGVESGTPFGIYYLRWTLEETQFKGSSKKYLKPRATVVEISDKNVYSIAFDSETIYVSPGYQSYPVSVSIEKEDREVYPYIGVEVSFEPQDSTVGISVSPEIVTLDIDWTTNFFVIECSDCVEGTEYTLNVTLGGEDAAAFKTVSTISFLYDYATTELPDITVTLDETTSVGFDFNVNSNTRAIVSWILVSEDIAAEYNLTMDTIEEYAYTYGSDGGKTVEDYIEEIQADYDLAYSENDEYEDIAYELLIIGSSIFVPGQDLVEAGDNLVRTFDFLVADSTYKVVAFADNFSGNPPDEVSQEATTLTLPPIGELTITLTSSSFDATTLAEQIAAAAKWRTELIYINDDRRRNLQTSLSGYAYGDLSSKISAADAINNNKDAIGLAIGGTISATAIDIAEYDDGDFDDYEWITDNGIYLMLNFTASVDGELICTIENGTDLVLSTDDVYSGVSESGEDIGVEPVEVTAGEESYQTWNFTELGYGESTYTVNCIICNDFPGLPSCSDVISTNYTYTGEEDNSDNDSSASALVIAIATYLLI
jgi:hypothetical protein